MTMTDIMASLEDAYRRVVESTGEAERPEMAATPRRAAEALAELTRGYRADAGEVVGGALFESDIDEMVLVGDIELYSLCEHHLLPFIGRCHVAYIPNGRVIGLSKIPELVDVFARRLQIQERLTEQIADSIEETTGAQGVGVIVEARHLCMLMRGIQKQGSVVTTSAMRGRFRRDPRTRGEFLRLARPSRDI